MNKTSVRFYILVLSLFTSLSVRAEGKKPDLTFEKLKTQSYKEFLAKSADTEFPTLVHSTENNVIKLGQKEVLVGIYERKDLSKNDENQEVRQVAVGFVKTGMKGDKEIFVKKDIDGFFDDGGSPVKILAVFSATFDKAKDPMLAILTLWDSSIAGGHSVMSQVGIQYEVHPYELGSTTLDFSNYKGSIANKLSTCDCQLFDDNGKKTGEEKAKFKTVKEVKQYLKTIVGQ
jgi:hypothetical protein